MEQSNLIFHACIVREAEGFSALCLDVDVASDGDTVSQAKENLREAVSLYVETAIESNLPIIRPVPSSEHPMLTRNDEIVEHFKISVSVSVDAHV